MPSSSARYLQNVFFFFCYQLFSPYSDANFRCFHEMMSYVTLNLFKEKKVLKMQNIAFYLNLNMNYSNDVIRVLAYFQRIRI